MSSIYIVLVTGILVLTSVSVIFDQFTATAFFILLCLSLFHSICSINSDISHSGLLAFLTNIFSSHLFPINFTCTFLWFFHSEVRRFSRVFKILNRKKHKQTVNKTILTSWLSPLFCMAPSRRSGCCWTSIKSSSVDVAASSSPQMSPSIRESGRSSLIWSKISAGISKSVSDVLETGIEELWSCWPWMLGLCKKSVPLFW